MAGTGQAGKGLLAVNGAKAEPLVLHCLIMIVGSIFGNLKSLIRNGQAAHGCQRGIAGNHRIAAGLSETFPCIQHLLLGIQPRIEQVLKNA